MPAPRDSHRVLFLGTVETKDRICVVMRVDGDWTLYIAGLGRSGGDCEPVPVEPDSPDGELLDLKKTTYFRSDAIRWVRTDRLRSRVCRIGLGLYQALDEVVEFALAKELVASSPPKVDARAAVVTPVTVTAPSPPPPDSPAVVTPVTVTAPRPPPPDSPT